MPLINAEVTTRLTRFDKLWLLTEDNGLTWTTARGARAHLTPTIGHPRDDCGRTAQHNPIRGAALEKAPLITMPARFGGPLSSS